MITQIARKEFKEMLRDGRFRWASGDQHRRRRLKP
jgi:hypothetical protein